MSTKSEIVEHPRLLWARSSHPSGLVECLLCLGCQAVPNHLINFCRSLSARIRSLMVLRAFSASRDLPPCFQDGWLDPAACPPPAPCRRQTCQPRTAGAWHRLPVDFALAVHRGAVRSLFAGSMRLSSCFAIAPAPIVDITDDGLATFLDFYALDTDGLIRL